MAVPPFIASRTRRLAKGARDGAVFQKPYGGWAGSLPLGSLFWLPGIKAKPRDQAGARLIVRLVLVGLPANESRQPNPQLCSKLPLRQAKLGPLFVDVFADGLGVGRQGRPDDA